MIARRHFLTGSAAVAPPPETTRVRLGAVPSICLSPQYVAEDLLRTDWRFLNELERELKG